MQAMNRSGVTFFLLSILVLAVGAPSASWGVTVMPPDGVTLTLVNDENGPKTNIEITVGPFFTGDTYTILGSGGENIGFIHINQNGSPSSVLDLFIRGDQGISSLNNIDEVDVTGGQGQVNIRELTIGGYLGKRLQGHVVSAHIIENVFVLINMYARIETLPPPQTTPPIVPKITNVQIFGNVIEGFVNDHGPIQLLQVAFMDPNLGGSPLAVIRCKALTGFTSLGNLKNVIIGKQSDPSFMTVDGMDVSGSFSGAVSRMDVKSIAGVVIKGDLDADITVADPLPITPDGVNTRALVIGGTFKDLNTITLPALGLASQIVINDKGLNGAWLGDVVVGATTLAPGYTNTASTLGNGSVGCVPFALHGDDSFPALGTCVDRTAAPDMTNPIKMSHYGPVKIMGGQGDPFKIERRAIGSANAWIDQSACFTQAVDVANNKTEPLINIPGTA